MGETWEQGDPKKGWAGDCGLQYKLCHTSCSFNNVNTYPYLQENPNNEVMGDWHVFLLPFTALARLVDTENGEHKVRFHRADEQKAWRLSKATEPMWPRWGVPGLLPQYPSHGTTPLAQMSARLP